MPKLTFDEVLELETGDALPVQHRAMPKLTYDEVLERLADQRHVRREEVQARALRRKVWISGAGSPGCLYDSGPYYHSTKKDAIENCVFISDDSENGPPRGIVTALRQGRSFYFRGRRYEISRDSLQSIL